MRYLLLVFSILSTVCTFGQRQNVYYMKSDGRLVPKDSADFIRVVREPDSGSVLYNILEFYPKGQKKLVAKSTKIDPVLSLEGMSLSYYQNGKRKELVTYKKNIRVGEAYTYFPNGQLYTVKTYGLPDTIHTNQVTPAQTILISACYDSTGKVLVTDGNGHYPIYNTNYKSITEQGEVKDGLKTGEWKGSDENGKLKFTETYEAGNLIRGNSADSVGNYTYTTRTIQPRYKNGINAFYKYLSENITYPTYERENGIQGTVLLSFIVTKSGDVKKIKVVRTVSNNIDAEASRVLARSKDWLPGVYYGRQKDALFTVPIAFALSQ